MLTVLLCLMLLVTATSNRDVGWNTCSYTGMFKHDRLRYSLKENTMFPCILAKIVKHGTKIHYFVSHSPCQMNMMASPVNK